MYHQYTAVFVLVCLDVCYAMCIDVCLVRGNSNECRVWFPRTSPGGRGSTADGLCARLPSVGILTDGPRPVPRGCVHGNRLSFLRPLHTFGRVPFLLSLNQTGDLPATRRATASQNEVALFHMPFKVGDGNGTPAMHAPNILQQLFLHLRWNSIPHCLRLRREFVAHMRTFAWSSKKGERATRR